MAWRIDIKNLFADFVRTAIPEVSKFGAWNSQNQNTDIEETKPKLAVYFEYSLIGDGLEYLLTTNMQQAEHVPVEVTLHICFDSFNEEYQNRAYDYAEALTCEIIGKKHKKILGRIMKVNEVEDTNHRALYDYQMSFAFRIKDAIFLDTPFVNANPETDEEPNADTGRRLKTEIQPFILKKYE